MSVWRRLARWQRNVALVAAAVVCSGLLYLFVGPAGQPDPPADLEKLAFVDGTLTVVEEDRLVLRAFDRREEIAFAVRERDRR